jgi:hypothetical protein
MVVVSRVSGLSFLHVGLQRLLLGRSQYRIDLALDRGRRQPLGSALFRDDDGAYIGIARWPDRQN